METINMALLRSANEKGIAQFYKHLAPLEQGTALNDPAPLEQGNRRR